ncbi:MAG TPA: ribonuclease H-like domain-containing protein, partial [Candidatus Limnocylindrales bacterium]|nr:ribonuclease H-like domain-containing protein [Candidatus Limnocylindrales bacterium]
MTDPTLTARRLERLRLSRQGVRRAAAVAAPPGSSASLRAGQLAAAVGGRVEQGPAGPVVVVESAGEVPLDHERLATLPYPIDLQRPLVCLDTETTGLGTAAGTLVFLVGLGSWDGQRFVVRQYLLPDHPDEPAFLDAVAAAIPDGAWLVTYNGRGFDWPLLVTRFRMQRRPPPLHAGHL